MSKNIDNPRVCPKKMFDKKKKRSNGYILFKEAMKKFWSGRKKKKSKSDKRKKRKRRKKKRGRKKKEGKKDEKKDKQTKGRTINLDIYQSYKILLKNIRTHSIFISIENDR